MQFRIDAITDGFQTSANREYETMFCCLKKARKARASQASDVIKPYKQCDWLKYLYRAFFIRKLLFIVKGMAAQVFTDIIFYL